MIRWVIAALLVFLVGLVRSAPAQLITSLAGASGLNLSVFSVAGSLWHGQLQGVVITSQKEPIYIDQVDWQLQASHLLLGEACLRLSLNYQQLPVKSDVCVSLGGQVSIENLSVTSQVAPLLDMLGFPFPVEGLVSLDVQQAQWSDQHGLIALQGVATAKNYAYRVGNQLTVLGDYHINLAAQQGQLLLKFTSGNALINLQGHVLVDPKGSYHAQLSFIPSQQASPELVNSLQFVAARQPDNSFILDYKGTF